MALLFLDDMKEASRFSTSSKDAFVRITPNHSAVNSAVWGIEDKCIYLGYGQEDETLIDKVLYIQDGKLGIGTSVPSAKCTIKANTEDLTNNSQILNIQDVLIINADGNIFLQQVSNSTSRLDINTDVYVQKPVLFDSDIITCGENIDIKSAKVKIGTNETTININGISIFNKPVTFIDKVDIYNPVFIGKDLTLHGNLYMISDGYVNSWYAKQDISSSHIISKKLTVNGDNEILLKGRTILLDGNVAIGKTNIIYPDILYISKSIELPLDRKIGIGKSPLYSIDTIGDINTDGNLTVKKDMTIGTENVTLYQSHKIYGNLNIFGKNNLIEGDTNIKGKLLVTKDCSIGQDYCPALLHIFGPTHVKENLYVHKDIYADKNIYTAGKILLTKESTPEQSIITLNNGSIHVCNGNLYLNTVDTKSIPEGISLYAKGNTFICGDTTVTGEHKINGTLSIGNNLNVKNKAVIEENLTVKKQTFVEDVFTASKETYLKDQVFVGKELHVAKDVYIGTVTPSRLCVDGTCTIKESLDTPQLNTQHLLIASDIRFGNRRYGIRNNLTASSDGYFMKFLHIPYRKGRTNFSVKVTGTLYNPYSSMRVEFEFGGNSQEPTLKSSSISGELKNANMENITYAVKLNIYRNNIQDYICTLRVPNIINIGYEFDFEIDNRCDIFAYTSLDTLIIKEEGWTLWWNIIASAHIVTKPNIINFQRKIGILEDNPLYMLDVNAPTRFQGKIYQPALPSLPSSIPFVQHAEQKYYAISDILEWLVQSVQTLQVLQTMRS